MRKREAMLKGLTVEGPVPLKGMMGAKEDIVNAR